MIQTLDPLEDDLLRDMRPKHQGCDLNLLDPFLVFGLVSMEDGFLRLDMLAEVGVEELFSLMTRGACSRCCAST